MADNENIENENEQDTPETLGDFAAAALSDGDSDADDKSVPQSEVESTESDIAKVEAEVENGDSSKTNSSNKTKTGKGAKVSISTTKVEDGAKKKKKYKEVKIERDDILRTFKIKPLSDPDYAKGKDIFDNIWKSMTRTEQKRVLNEVEDLISSFFIKDGLSILGAKIMKINPKLTTLENFRVGCASLYANLNSYLTYYRLGLSSDVDTSKYVERLVDDSPYLRYAMMFITNKDYLGFRVNKNSSSAETVEFIMPHGCVCIFGQSESGKTTISKMIKKALGEDVAFVGFHEPDINSLNRMEDLNRVIRVFLDSSKERVLIIDSLRYFLYNTDNNSTILSGGVSSRIFKMITDLSILAKSYGKTVIAVINIFSDNEKIRDEVGNAIIGASDGYFLSTRTNYGIYAQVRFRNLRHLDQITINIAPDDVKEFYNTIYNKKCQNPFSYSSRYKSTNTFVKSNTTESNKVTIDATHDYHDVVTTGNLRMTELYNQGENDDNEPLDKIKLTERKSSVYTINQNIADQLDKIRTDAEELNDDQD